jgi:hypothetical protein
LNEIQARVFLLAGVPDPLDPHVFGPPGSGSFYQEKIVKTLFCDFFWTFILKNDVKVPSKSNKQKNFLKNSFLLAS